MLFITTCGVFLFAINMHYFLLSTEQNSTLPYKCKKNLSYYGIVQQTASSFYNTTLENEPTNKETSKYMPILDVASNYIEYKAVIPRTAYYDNRIIEGTHRNIIVILAEVKSIILENKLIISCEINGEYSTAIEVITDPIMKWVQTHKGGYTHFFATIHCYGLPSTAISNGNMVSVIYRSSSGNKYISVHSEYSLQIMSDRYVHNENSIVVCTTMYGNPVRFEEWLRYLKTLGVDMVHVSAQVSFAANMTLAYPFLAESLTNGFVKIHVWKSYLQEKEIFYYSQSLFYQDCVIRYRHLFEYAMMIDYDDYFIPVISNKKNIHYYLKLLFSSKDTASARLPWIEYHCQILNNAIPVDGNITNSLSGKNLSKRLESKSIHKLSAVDTVSIHRAYTTLPGYNVMKVYGIQTAYVAHIKPNSVKCNLSQSYDHEGR